MNKSELVWLAQIALLAQRTKSGSKGEPPSQSDIAALLDGKLDFKRRDEVFSHLNRNPDAYSQWIGLVEARHNLLAAQKTKSGIIKLVSGWLTRLFDSIYVVPGLAAGLLVVLIVAYLPITVNTAQSWQTLTSQFGNDETTKTQEQLLGLVTAIAADCKNLMAIESHREEYKQMLQLYKLLDELPSDILLTPDAQTFLSTDKTCDFNQALLDDLNG